MPPPVGPINPVILEFPVKVPDARVDLDPVGESRSSFVAGMTEEYWLLTDWLEAEMKPQIAKTNSFTSGEENERTSSQTFGQKLVGQHSRP